MEAVSRIRLLLIPGLLVAVATCAGPTEPSLSEKLLGTWGLASINGYQIPGSVEFCYTHVSPGGIPYWACDSTYIASGQLVLRPDHTCAFARVFVADTSAWSCTYIVNGNSASIHYDGAAPKDRFDLTVEGEDLWVSSAPCDPFDYGCSPYTEQYHRRRS